MIRSQKYTKTWIKFNKKSLEGWIDFIKISIPAGSLEYVKWISNETSYNIYNFLNKIYWMKILKIYLNIFLKVILLSGMFNNEKEIAALA